MGEVKGMFIRQTFFKSFSKSLYLLAFKAKPSLKTFQKACTYLLLR